MSDKRQSRADGSALDEAFENTPVEPPLRCGKDRFASIQGSPRRIPSPLLVSQAKQRGLKLYQLRVFLGVVAVLLCAIAPRAVTQTPAGLSIQTYVGLTITGAVGTVYTLQYNTDLAQSNG